MNYDHLTKEQLKVKLSVVESKIKRVKDLKTAGYDQYYCRTVLNDLKRAKNNIKAAIKNT
jgi:hypothetical protein